MRSDISKAPWTPRQVGLLQERQENEKLHEYTCECGAVLIPTAAGWVCRNRPHCPYTQNWCHAIDVGE